MSKWIIDDCGTLINMETRNTYDYVSEIVDILNEQEEQLKKSNQEITASHNTLLIIEALCDAVLQYDFLHVESKTDFCHMLNEMDNKDLAFFKECFEAIKNNDLRKMVSLTSECLNEGDTE